MPYRLGSDGSDGHIDCIHLVTTVLDRLGIGHPEITDVMYDASKRQVARWLFAWGRRVAEPTYDGDVLLLPTEQKAFGVVWDSGILSIESMSSSVRWTPVSSFSGCPCFRSNAS